MVDNFFSQRINLFSANEYRGEWEFSNIHLLLSVKN